MLLRRPAERDGVAVSDLTIDAQFAFSAKVALLPFNRMRLPVYIDILSGILSGACHRFNLLAVAATVASHWLCQGQRRKKQRQGRGIARRRGDELPKN